MYASIRISLKGDIEYEKLKQGLEARYGRSVLSVDEVLKTKSFERYKEQALCAAHNQDAEVIYFLFEANEIYVIAYGERISTLKAESKKCLKLLRKINGVKIREASSGIMVELNGIDVDLVVGKEKSWLVPFKETFIERFGSKVVSAGVTVGAAVWIFPPTATPIYNAFIGLGATFVGVVFESVQSAWRAESWSWRESQ